MFEDWKSDFLTRSGFPKRLADRLKPLQLPITADRQQSEARKTLKQYLDITVTDARIAKGRALLDSAPRYYPIDPAMLMSIWGMETNFGTVLGDQPVFAALATLAANGRRRPLFEDQLMAAAQMVAQGVDPDTMIGSWAGAIGHTQFMPRSWMNFAVSADDGLPDLIQRSKDALLSSAHYLHYHGAHSQIPWGATVDLPKGLDLKSARHAKAMCLEEWHRLGISTNLPDAHYRFILPAGHKGSAFLVSQTYDAVLAYNNADAYALAVCHLADRINHKDGWDGPWPCDTRALSVDEMSSLQAQLTHLGFDTQGADGFTGPNTIRAIENYQQTHALPVDGFAGLDLYQHLMGI